MLYIAFVIHLFVLFTIPLSFFDSFLPPYLMHPLSLILTPPPTNHTLPSPSPPPTTPSLPSSNHTLSSPSPNHTLPSPPFPLQYIIILTIIVLLEIAAGVIALVFKDKLDTQSRSTYAEVWNNAIDKYNTSDSDTKSTIDSIQKYVSR